MADQIDQSQQGGDSNSQNAQNAQQAPAYDGNVQTIQQGDHMYIRTNTPGANPDATPLTAEEGGEDNATKPEFDGTYWDTPKEETPDPNKVVTPPATESDPADPMKAINAMVDGLDFGEGIKPTEEMLAEMEKGDFNLFNTNLMEGQKKAAVANMQVTAKMLHSAMDQMKSMMTNLIATNTKVQSRTNAMLEGIPAAKDPSLRPMVEGMFAQSLARHKGDATKAVAETNAFIKHFASQANPQLETPPGAAKNGGTGSTQQTAEEGNVDFTEFFTS